ncbi:MAG: hypothetical protein E7680_02115 [Ruminococcaceae bacterium]|nr:hypothetical protein [Oscillospiraceae bacterium]
MKRILIILLVVAMLLVSSCSAPNNKESNNSNKETIEITADNFQDYFYSDVYGDIKTNTSAIGTTYFVNTIHLSFDLKQTAGINNVTVKGRIDLKVSRTHLLYSEGKLPLYFTVNIPASGHGETTLYFQHGTGAYGGYTMKDFYITIESATGTIIIY